MPELGLHFLMFVLHELFVLPSRWHFFLFFLNTLTGGISISGRSLHYSLEPQKSKELNLAHISYKPHSNYYTVFF